MYLSHAQAKAKTREATPLPGPPKQLISAPKGVPGFVPSTSDSLLKIDTPRGAQKPKHPFVASSSTAAHQPAVPATKAAGAARSTGNPAPAQSSDRGVQRSRSSLTAAEVTQHGADARTGNSQAGKALHSAKGGSELGSSAGHVSTGAVSGSKVQTEEVEEGELEPGERVEGYESGPDAERGAPEPEGPRGKLLAAPVVDCYCQTCANLLSKTLILHEVICTPLSLLPVILPISDSLMPSETATDTATYGCTHVEGFAMLAQAKLAALLQNTA